jgi:diguanylate cyclase (GGDEF)-like protein
MRPFITEKSCLKCHASQGYTEGDIRGGISVSIPMKPLWNIMWITGIKISIAHGLIWIIGLIGIGFSAKRLIEQVHERERLTEQLSVMSTADELTGLYNRRGFFTLSQQQMKVAERTKKDMLLFFADLDKMKQINDTLGHQEGDNALLEIASILKEAFRESDIIGRMGGDEFAILAIDTTDETKEVLMKRLHAILETYNRPDKKYQLSLSVGISHYDPEHPSSLDELMAQADTLMYEEKRNKQY